MQRIFFSRKRKNAILSKVKGSKKFIDQSNAYIDGTAAAKKCNFKKHLTHKNHKTAALRLKEALISYPGNEMWIICGFNLDYLWFK